MREKLAQDRYLTAEWPRIKLTSLAP